MHAVQEISLDQKRILYAYFLEHKAEKWTGLQLREHLDIISDRIEDVRGLERPQIRLQYKKFCSYLFAHNAICSNLMTATVESSWDDGDTYLAAVNAIVSMSDNWPDDWEEVEFIDRVAEREKFEEQYMEELMEEDNSLLDIFENVVREGIFPEYALLWPSFDDNPRPNMENISWEISEIPQDILNHAQSNRFSNQRMGFSTMLFEDIARAAGLLVDVPSNETRERLDALFRMFEEGVFRWFTSNLRWNRMVFFRNVLLNQSQSQSQQQQKQQQQRKRKKTKSPSHRHWSQRANDYYEIAEFPFSERSNEHIAMVLYMAGGIQARLHAHCIQQAEIIGDTATTAESDASRQGFLSLAEVFSSTLLGKEADYDEFILARTHWGASSRSPFILPHPRIFQVVLNMEAIAESLALPDLSAGLGGASQVWHLTMEALTQGDMEGEASEAIQEAYIQVTQQSWKEKEEWSSQALDSCAHYLVESYKQIRAKEDRFRASNTGTYDAREKVNYRQSFAVGLFAQPI